MNLYFIAAHGEIKIGIAANVRTRLATLARQRQCELHLIGVMPGGRKLEAAIHKYLSVYRLHGEWFTDDPFVVATVGALLKRGPAAIGLPDGFNVGQDLHEVAREWFRKIASVLWPVNAGACIAALTGKGINKCYRHASGKSELDGHTFIKLLQSEEGGRLLDAVMDGCHAPWWLEFKSVPPVKPEQPIIRRTERRVEAPRKRLLALSPREKSLRRGGPDNRFYRSDFEAS